jgi:hypothetical protein
MTIYDPPTKDAPVWQWEAYLAELSPAKDAEEIARTRDVIAKLRDPNFSLADFILRDG